MRAMTLLEIFILAVGLSMDAFALSVAVGLQTGGGPKPALSAGLWFGGAQFVMPVAGWILGSVFVSFIEHVATYVAFVLLAAIGAKMIFDAIKEMRAKPGELPASADTNPLRPARMLLLSVADSVDALSAGITFPLLGVNVWQASAIIGATTCALSAAGVQAGAFCGLALNSKAEIAGGLVLVALAVSVLVRG
jgi:putative Mn2+ efflux pump MntP